MQADSIFGLVGGGGGGRTKLTTSSILGCCYSSVVSGWLLCIPSGIRLVAAQPAITYGVLRPDPCTTPPPPPSGWGGTPSPPPRPCHVKLAPAIPRLHRTAFPTDLRSVNPPNRDPSGGGGGRTAAPSPRGALADLQHRRRCPETHRQACACLSVCGGSEAKEGVGVPRGTL